MSDDGGFFDRLTGRDELQERIAELEERVKALEEENESLEAQLDAEQERRSSAVSEKQSIAEERNRLQDRIAELEGKVAETDQRHDHAFSTVSIPYTRAEEFVSRVRSVRTDEEGACTAMLNDGAQLPDPVRDVLTDAAVERVQGRTPCIVLVDDMGLCRVAVETPRPFDTDVSWGTSFALESRLVYPEEQFTFGLLRSDTFVMAEYDGTTRGEVTTITSDVKSDHSKGGFSQGRFERRRDAQIAAHLEKVNDALNGAVEPSIVVGETSVLSELDGVAQTATSDATGASAEALDEAFRGFWTTRVTRL